MIENGIQALFQRVQFVVHCNAQRLKGAAGGVLVFAALCRGHRACYNVCQLQGGQDGGSFPRLHDLSCDLPCVGFLAVVPQDTGQFLAAFGVHKVCGGLTLLAHAHIQRCICPVGKAPGGIVQLVAGNAKIQQCTVDLFNAQLLQRLPRIAEIDLHHGGRQPGKTRPRGLHRVRILIQRDESAALGGVQPQSDLAGMSRAAGGAVQIGARRVDGKPCQALVQQNGDMLKRGRVKGLLFFKGHWHGLLSRFNFLHQRCSLRSCSARWSLVTAARRAFQTSVAQISAWLRLPMMVTSFSSPA